MQAEERRGSQPDLAPDTHVFHTAEALKALADPLRLRLLLLMADRPVTVKEAAEALGVPPTRLYYHVKILERHGLIEVTDRRVVSGIEERTYGALAKNWTMSPSLAASAISTSGTLRAVINLVRAELEAGLQQRPEAPMSSDISSPLPAVGLTQLALSPDELEEVEARLGGLMDDFGAATSAEADGKPLYRMFFAVYQTPKGPAQTDDE
ncbi:MAG: helix-turn-helix domain-containing protein [Actinomycetota bacterium]